MAVTADRTWDGGRPLRSTLYGDLVWLRPNLFRRELVLEAGSDRVASLTWPRWYSFDVVAESADGRWLIHQRRGWRRSFRVVSDADAGTEVATFHYGWRGKGTVRFVSGAEYGWKREGFWRARYHWSRDPDKPLLTYRSVIAFRKSFEMTIDPAARSLAELPVLVLLGGYVMSAILASSRSS
jgi:hypothetical protein